MKRIVPGLAILAILILGLACTPQKTALIQPQYPHQHYEPDPDDDFEYTIIGDGAAVEISEYRRANVNVSNVIDDCKSTDYEDVFDNGFDDFYLKNGKKAGTYILNGGQWRMNNS